MGDQCLNHDSMSKRVLFVFPSLGIGGTTVSVRNLISLLEKEGIDCWFMPLYPYGVLEFLYDGLKRIRTPFVIKAMAISSWKKEKSISRIIIASLRFLRNHFSEFERLIVGKTLDRIVRKYQINTIVACQESRTTRFVSYATIGKKVAWVRCDMKRISEEDDAVVENYYDSFNSIVCVSDLTCKNFRQVFPQYSLKAVCIPNPQDGNLIKERAKMIDNDSRFVQEGITLVSIGRFDAVKRFDQIAPIALSLIKHGMKFRWYLIGEGEERSRIEESIKQYEVSSHVVLLGAKTNPYYYIKKADALVCLSRSEACPRVVNEAKILHTPTISTDFPTIYEFIQDRKTGIISSIEKMPLAIIDLFEDRELYESIKERISQFTFENGKLIAEIKALL